MFLSQTFLSSIGHYKVCGSLKKSRRKYSNHCFKRRRPLLNRPTAKPFLSVLESFRGTTLDLIFWSKIVFPGFVKSEQIQKLCKRLRHFWFSFSMCNIYEKKLLLNIKYVFTNGMQYMLFYWHVHLTISTAYLLSIASC